ncbi:MAG TPA: sensor domain-containing diguanylate cyclase [Roseiflexaceae bacterium]|nr:sensor domain-containing diguanylate cyclase [Roseiflexaceae bacterium]
MTDADRTAHPEALIAEIEALRATLADIAAALELPRLLRAIVERAARFLDATDGQIALYDAESRELVLYATYNIPESAIGSRIRLDQGLSGLAASTKQPQMVDDYLTWEGHAAPGEGPGPRPALAVPLLAGEELVGVINVGRHGSHRVFTAADAHQLSLFAQQATVAIQNARLLEAARQRAEEAETLRRVGAVVASTLRQDEAIDRILEQLVLVVPYDSASVLLLHGDAMEIVGGRGFPDPAAVIGLRISVYGDNATSAVFASRAPLRLDDAPAAFGAFKEPPHDRIKSWLGAPLIFQERLIGMIAVDSTRPARFTANHERMVAAFADQVAVALENARLYQEALAAAERRTVLYEVSQAIGASLNLDQLYETIHHATARLMPCQAFLISLLDEPAGELEDVYLSDPSGRWPGSRYPMDIGFCGHVVRTRRNLYLDNLTEQVMRDFGSWYFGQPEHQVRSVLAVPLRVGERIIGVISTQAYAPHAYSPTDIEIFEQLAANAAIALENARLFAETRRLAITDPLMGVFNRRHFFELARGELERARRYHHPLAIVMLDIDEFKRINDTYGHLVGDQVLRGVAARCKSALRTVDVLGRYGGEELVVLLPETGPVGALEAAERLRLSIAQTPIDAEGIQVAVTASLGVTTWTPAADTRLEDLLDAADRALYEAKRRGRNQVRVL